MNTEIGGDDSTLATTSKEKQRSNNKMHHITSRCVPQNLVFHLIGRDRAWPRCFMVFACLPPRCPSAKPLSMQEESTGIGPTTTRARVTICPAAFSLGLSSDRFRPKGQNFRVGMSKLPYFLEIRIVCLSVCLSVFQFCDRLRYAKSLRGTVDELLCNKRLLFTYCFLEL